MSSQVKDFLDHFWEHNCLCTESGNLKTMFKLIISVEHEPLTKELVAALQHETCRQHNGKTPKGSNVAELQALRHKMTSSIFIVDSPEANALFKKLQDRPISPGSIRNVLTVHGKKAKGHVKRGSLAAKLQSIGDRVQAHKDKGRVVSIEVKVIETYPVSQERARQVQSETQLEIGFVGKDSMAAMLQSAAQKSENAKCGSSLSSTKVGGGKGKSRSLIDSDEESDDLPPRFR